MEAQISCVYILKYHTKFKITKLSRFESLTLERGAPQNYPERQNLVTKCGYAVCPSCSSALAQSYTMGPPPKSPQTTSLGEIRAT